MGNQSIATTSATIATSYSHFYLPTRAVISQVNTLAGDPPPSVVTLLSLYHLSFLITSPIAPLSH